MTCADYGDFPAVPFARGVGVDAARAAKVARRQFRKKDGLDEKTIAKIGLAVERRATKGCFHCHLPTPTSLSDPHMSRNKHAPYERH